VVGGTGKQVWGTGRKKKAHGDQKKQGTALAARGAHGKADSAGAGKRKTGGSSKRNNEGRPKKKGGGGGRRESAGIGKGERLLFGGKRSSNSKKKGKIHVGSTTSNGRPSTRGERNAALPPIPLRGEKKKKKRTSSAGDRIPRVGKKRKTPAERRADSWFLFPAQGKKGRKTISLGNVGGGRGVINGVWKRKPPDKRGGRGEKTHQEKRNLKFNHQGPKKKEVAESCRGGKKRKGAEGKEKDAAPPQVKKELSKKEKSPTPRKKRRVGALIRHRRGEDRLYLGKGMWPDPRNKKDGENDESVLLYGGRVRYGKEED